MADPAPSKIENPALNVTVWSGFGSAITVLGGAAIGIAKAAGANIPQGVTIAAFGVVAVGLLAIALVVSADLRCRAAVKVAEIENAPVTPMTHGPEGGPLVEVNVDRLGEVSETPSSSAKGLREQS